MKVTVAVDRTRAAARWSEGRGERRQSAWNLRTGAAARTRLGGSTPWTSRPCKLSPGWTAEKQENGLPAAICNVSICARVCSLLEEDNNKPVDLTSAVCQEPVTSCPKEHTLPLHCEGAVRGVRAPHPLTPAGPCRGATASSLPPMRSGPPAPSQAPPCPAELQVSRNE
ncbi:uncharacterized protein LOC123938779 isoform X3 [Meles meles]|uniref:uncharacterized protein LOC123938779 isoform X3 n=1 Tax=Meles meles TaxID=9662 RepID=UPI001E698661|nr:uncharacterized protein LOC123938779 isoform X3 [Meles meles]